MYTVSGFALLYVVRVFHSGTHSLLAPIEIRHFFSKPIRLNFETCMVFSVPVLNDRPVLHYISQNESYLTNLLSHKWVFSNFDILIWNMKNNLALYKDSGLLHRCHWQV